MRAVRIEAFGEPADVLVHVEIPEPPPPAADEVLISVEHAPINMNDLSLIQGVFPIRPSLPSVAGNEGVGWVLAFGSGVEHLKTGDHVLIPLYSFSWRERLVVPAARLFALPHMLLGNSVVQAVTLGDVILFRDTRLAADPLLWAHELTHVEQYRRLGVEGFALRYVQQAWVLEQEAITKANTIKSQLVH